MNKIEKEIDYYITYAPTSWYGPGGEEEPDWTEEDWLWSIANAAIEQCLDEIRTLAWVPPYPSKELHISLLNRLEALKKGKEYGKEKNQS